MTLSILGTQYICQKFGDENFCCVASGLSWYYTKDGTDYNETGGTAQAVSRLASGLVDSLTMTNPARGTFTQAELDAANQGSVTLADCQEITLHDEPSEDQWCFIACENITNAGDCVAYGCYWYNGACHTDPPTCDGLDNASDCSAYDCFWYRDECHGVDQLELCYWIDAKGGPAALAITDVFEMVDSFLFSTPPTGYSFVPTLANVFGIIDYFLGFNGDALTGCFILT